MLAFLCQTLFTLSCIEAPVRFGIALSEGEVARGLCVRTGALSVRPLPLCARDGLVWLEIAAVADSGRVRVELGGGPLRNAVETHESDAHDPFSTAASRIAQTRWVYADGTSDERRVHEFVVDADHRGERFSAGERLTEDSDGAARRCEAVLQLPRAFFERAGLLPSNGALGKRVRDHLAEVARALVELPGLRGAGDYARSGGVVTNLEFDTTLALLRLGLALGDESLLQRARRSALHLCDRDLDERTGLPFRHGPDHRAASPEPGHAWLQGLLWTGAVCADDRMLLCAQQIARGLAAMPAVAEGEGERARDYAWPLRELEAYLAWRADPVVEAAADRMAAAIAVRYRPDLRTFCFGEGAFTDGAGYFERGWITGGVVLPALRSHLARKPDRELQRAVDEATEHLVQRIGQGRGGIPTHWRALRGSVFAEHRAEHDPKAFLMLEALPFRDLKRLLTRPHVQRAFDETPVLDDVDLATSFTLVARCEWIYR
jgi:hypothetical protein